VNVLRDSVESGKPAFSRNSTCFGAVAVIV